MKPFQDEKSHSFLLLLRKQPKVNPIPFVKTKFKEAAKMDRKLTVHGCKYFQKISAFGECTSQILRHTKRSSSLKYVKEFEFDPYFCELSCINHLEWALDKLKGKIKNLNIVIRRVQRKEEIKRIAQCLYKLNRMTKLRIELPSTEKLQERDLVPLGRAVSLCYILRSLEINVICMPNIGQRGFRNLAYKIRKLKKLESLTLFPYAFYSPENQYEDKVVRFPKLKVKFICVKLACKTNWTSMTDGAAQFLPAYINSLADSLDPIDFRFTIHKLPTSTEAIFNLSQLLPKLLKARYVFLELENNKLDENELMLLANGVRKARQIEQFTFKFIEYSYIGLEYLFGFVKVIAGANFLKKFDLFFRKLKYSEWESNDLREQLSSIENINYSLSKESLHVYFDEMKKLKF